MSLFHRISSGNEPDSTPDAGVETTNNTLDHDALETVSDTLKGGFQTGALEDALGVEMTAVKVSAAVPSANDSSWNEFLETADVTSGGDEELRKPTHIVAEWTKTQQQEGATFLTEVLVKFLDDKVHL